MLEGIDYQACGFCRNEEICKIRDEYMKSDNRRPHGTADLAKECGKYEFDSKADCHLHPIFR